MAADDPVMIATDLSPRSDRPFERAFLLADQLDSPLLVLHVLERKKQLSQEEEELLLARIEEEFGAKPDNAEILIERGDVPKTIVRVADERNCALVLVGVARFNSPADYVLGTAVDHLVRKSRTPVVVVKRRPRRPYRRLLACTDFSSGSMYALIKAAQLFGDAELRLIHVYHSAYDAFLAHDSTADYIRREAQNAMKAFTDALPEAVRSRVEPAVLEGHLAGVVEDEIRNWRADLLVLGTHGGSGFTQATVGSQAADLLEYEPCDIFVARELKAAR